MWGYCIILTLASDFSKLYAFLIFISFDSEFSTLKANVLDNSTPSKMHNGLLGSRPPFSNDSRIKYAENVR